jgi:hypothetical protein
MKHLMLKTKKSVLPWVEQSRLKVSVDSIDLLVPPHKFLKLFFILTIQTQPWQCLSWGAVGAISVVPAAITIFLVIALFGTLFAVTLSMFIPPLIGVGFLTYIALSLGLTLIVAYLAPILVIFFGGQRLMQLVRPMETSKMAILGIGLLIFVIMTAIPVLGGVLV